MVISVGVLVKVQNTWDRGFDICHDLLLKALHSNGTDCHRANFSQKTFTGTMMVDFKQVGAVEDEVHKSCT